MFQGHFFSPSPQSFIDLNYITLALAWPSAFFCFFCSAFFLFLPCLLKIRIWSKSGRCALAVLEVGAPVACIAWARQGRALAVVSSPTGECFFVNVDTATMQLAKNKVGDQAFNLQPMHAPPSHPGRGGVTPEQGLGLALGSKSTALSLDN